MSEALWVIGCLGRTVYEEIPYRVAEECELRTRFSTIAIARWWMRSREVAPSRTLTFATREAWAENGGALVAAAREHGLPAPEHVEIPLGRSREELQELARRIAARIDPGVRLAMDLTMGLRHQPFAMLAALSVLAATKGVTVEGIYYGARELRDGDGPCPVLDFSWVLEVFELGFACRLLADRGDADPLAGMLLGESERRGREGTPRPALRRVGRLLRDCMAELTAPLAAQLLTRRIARDPVGEDGRRELEEWSPLAKDLVVGRLEQFVRRLTLADPPAEPAELELSPEVLEVQLRHVEKLLELGEGGAAVRLLWEHVVNRVLHARGRTSPGTWLDVEVRRDEGSRIVNRFLDAHRRLDDAGRRDLGAWLSRLSDLRNKLAHAGHRIDRVHLHRLHEVCSQVCKAGRHPATDWRLDAADRA